jgi:hypothetical protein
VRSVATHANLPTMPQTYSVAIDGVSVFVIAGSLTIDRTIGKRSQASFTIRSDTSSHFQQYQQVAIHDGTGTLVFSGYISQPQEQKPGYQPSLIHTIQCIDQHFLADKRVVAAQYSNKTCGYIVQDLVNTILSEEGVTIGQIYDGVTPSDTLYPSPTLYPGGNVGLIPSATFVYCTVAQALDELVKQASLAGIPYYWMIDENKQLWFVPYTSVVNSNVVDGSKVDQKNIPCIVQRANPAYRNTQYIIGGTAETVQQTETRKGDSNTTAWTMGYNLAHVPTIKVNGVQKTVGIKGIDTGKDWYWNKGDSTITQDSSGTILTTSDTLQVVYIGQYPSVVISQDGGQVAYESDLDGSSGVIEVVMQDATITSINNGLSEAGQLLTRYAQQGTQIQFSTMVSGYAPGQLITVDMPWHALNSTQMLIEEVSSSDQADRINIWHQIKAISGPYDVSWQDFFSTLLKQQQIATDISVGVSQSITVLVSGTLDISPTLAMEVEVYACPLPSSSLYPSTTLYPC